MNVQFWNLAVVWMAAMAAMMLPVALPMVALFRRAVRHRYPDRPWLPVWFAAAYGGVWLLFSLGLAAIQWYLRPASTSVGLTVALLVGAGLYQFSPWKQACLRNCRSPLTFLLDVWRPGWQGAVMLGIRHGLSCLGCCWALMLLMLGAGMMTPVAMLAVAILMTAERWLPLPSPLVVRINGMLLFAWAALLSGNL